MSLQAWQEYGHPVTVDAKASPALAKWLHGLGKSLPPGCTYFLEVRRPVRPSDIETAAHYAYLERVRSGAGDDPDGFNRDRRTAEEELRNGVLTGFALIDATPLTACVHWADAIDAVSYDWEALAGALSRLGSQVSGYKTVEVYNPIRYLREKLELHGFKRAEGSANLWIR